MRAIRLVERRDDRGAVLIIVAVFSLVALIMLAAVVDLGGLRQEKREVTLSTDAAALAGVVAAQFAGVVTDQPCESVVLNAEALRLYAGEVPPPLTVADVVENYLRDNGESEYVNCTVHPDGEGSGFVEVVARDSVNYAFSGAVGQSSGEVSGTSSASYTLDLGGGLRPIGICELTNSLDLPVALDFGDQLALVRNQPITDVVRFTITLPVERLGSGNDCGNASGHFGQIDFADNGNGQGTCDPSRPVSFRTDTYCEYLFNGWYGDPEAVWSGDPGNNYNSPEAVFAYVRDVVGHFWVPVYDEVPDCSVPARSRPPSCSEVTGTPFMVSYYAEVGLDSFCLDGDANAACRIHKDVDGNGRIANDEKFRWIKLDVYGAVTLPISVLPKTADAEPIPARICAVSSDTSYCG